MAATKDVRLRCGRNIPELQNSKTPNSESNELPRTATDRRDRDVAPYRMPHGRAGRLAPPLMCGAQRHFTDFNNLTRRQIQNIENIINPIHSESLNGETTYVCDSRLPQTS